MPKEEWGVKRVCPTTGKRFYDLNKDPIVSPYTGEVVEMQNGKSRMISADAEDAATKKAAAGKYGDAIDLGHDAEVDVRLGHGWQGDRVGEELSLDGPGDGPAGRQGYGEF